MNYASLLHELPEELIGIFRKYEQEKKKEINAHWSLVFNIYIYIYILYILKSPVR